MWINKDRTWKKYRRASLRPHIQHHQLSHVTLNYSLPLVVCVLMLPMLVVAVEHMQLATTYRMNPLDRCSLMTFIRTPLLLPSLNNVLPAMVLQNRGVRLNTGYLSRFLSHFSVQHVFPSPDVRVYSRMGRRVVGVVVILLLLLCGDIETNPGPLGLHDLPFLHRELYQVSHKWFALGVQLQIQIGTLKSIESDNHHQTTKCLLEMLTVWLQRTNPPPTWNILIGALESPPVDERLVAQQLRDKYCPKREGGVTHDYHTQGPPSSGALPTPQVQLGRSQGHFLPSQVQTAPLHQSTQSTVSLTQPPVTASTNLTPPEITTPPEPHMVAHTVFLDKQSVKQQMKELETRFSDLVDCTYEALLQKKVDDNVRSFRSRLLSLDVSRKSEHQKFINEHLVIIDQGTTFDVLWARLNNYWNFLNFNLLEYIMDKYKIEDLQCRMGSYVHDLKSFRKATRLCDFIECWPVEGETPPLVDLQEFVIKMNYDWDNCTLEDLETLKGVITRKFFLPEFALQLKKMMEGSIVITWLIPTPFVMALREAVKSTSIEFFMEQKIATITIAGRECYSSPTGKHVDCTQTEPVSTSSVPLPTSTPSTTPPMYSQLPQVTPSPTTSRYILPLSAPQELLPTNSGGILTTTSGAHRGVGYSVASFPGPPSSGALPTPQVQLGRSQGPFLPSQVQTAPLHQSTQSTISLTQPPVTASTNLTPPEMTTPTEPHMVAHTGRLLNTTSGAHGGVESEDGGEELSTPPVKRKCVQDDSVLLVSGLGRDFVHNESVAPPRHLSHHHQHQHPHPQHQLSQYPHPSPQHSYHPLFYPSHPQVRHHPPQHQPPAHSSTYHPPNYPSFGPPLEQPSYQYTEPTQPSYYQPSHHIPNPLPAETAHHQSHNQTPPQSVYMYQPSYQHPSLPPHHSPPCPPSLDQHTSQHPEYHQLPTLQSSHLPPFHPFHQEPFKALVQPVHSYQPSSQPSPHPDSPLGKYALFLRGYYTQHHAPCTKWPQLHIRKYINLAVINNVFANRKDLVEFIQQTIHGSIDDILEWKAPIKMKNILKPNCMYDDEKHEHYPVTQLLIEGAPGIGKSTFAWEVCQKWGQQQLFNEYSLVVLLKFRDKRVQEAKSVSDLFYYPHPKLQSEIFDYIIVTGGHGLLLILEGFDEAPASKQTMDSIFVRLFKGQVLPKATVILTTRPSASRELRQFCNSVNSRRIEIVGFRKKEIDEYIQCAFSDDQSQSDFKEYLSLYPHIHSMMYVPLNSAIVTHVYESCKSSGTVVPKTMTQLYSCLIRTLLLRYLKDKEEYKDTCTTISSFKGLPQPVYDQFCKICKIAYTGIMSAQTKLIFQDLPSDFDPLELMQACPELYVDRGASVSCNFLHLTIQEYLAAYHISQQSRDEQVAFMRDKIFEMEVIVRFLAGLTELGRDLWDVVREFASEDELYINTTFLSEESFIKLEILHLLFESQDPSAITSVLGSDYVCFYDYDSIQQSFDWYVLGYCIAHSSCDWKLELDECKLESVELFLRALNLHQDQCQLSPTGKIKEMWLRESGPAAVHLLVDSMSQLVVFHNLTHLGLVECGLTSETCNLLSKQNLQHLEYLNLDWNLEIGRGGVVNLITSLTKFSTITEMYLAHTGIGLEDCKALSELLATSKYIKVLDIGNEELDNPRLSPDSIHLIIDGLSHNTSLEKLDICGSNFSSVNVLHLASVLRANARLKELDIRYCNIQSSGSVHLAKALEENTTTQLQTLVLSGNPIGSEGAVASASMLKKNQCLKTLELDDDSVGVEGALELIESLKHNATLEKLMLSEKCKPPSFSTLDKALQDCVIFGEVLGEQSSDDQYISISKQVMEEHGTMDQTIMHCIFVGPAGVGKSSLLKRLLHQKLNPERCSTQLSEKSVRVEVIRDVSKMVAKVTGFEWKIMEDTDTQGFELIRQWFRKQKKVSKDSSTVDYSNHQVSEHLNDQTIPGSEVREQLEKASQDNQSTVGSSNEKVPEQTGQVSQTEPLNISEDTTLSSHDSVVPQHSQHNKRMEFLLHVLREKGISGLRQHVDNPHTLYLTDSGGQPGFQELLPALVVGPCVFFVVFPIHEDLTLKHKVRYVRPGCTQEYISSLTVQEDILRSLASIASTKYLDIDGNEVKPKVLLIATFKDQVPLEEDRKKRLKALEALVKETDAFRQKMILSASATQITFTVNNLSDEESEEDAKKIRHVVEQVADEFKIRTPFPWLIFNILVQYVYAKDNVINEEECFELAQECGMKEIEFKAALQFLHKQTGVLHYYEKPPELSQIVIRDPQHLFSRVTELVERTFVYGKTLYGCCIQNFEKGIFTKEDYDKLTKDLSRSKLTPSMLLKLLKHLNVVVPLGNQKYFMPCAITHIDKETATGRTQSRTIPPLLITFKSGYCPKGLFGGLIACIANRQVGNCTLNLDESKIHRDQICFTMDRHHLLLRVNPTYIYIEIIPYDPKASLSTFCIPCNCVRNLILANIKTACEKLHYAEDNIDCHISFECPCNQPENFHPAALRTDMNNCFMCIRSKKVMDVKKECYVWLPQPTIIQNPESQSVTSGSVAEFRVEATGDVLQFQWQKNGTNIHDHGSRYRGTNTDTLRILMVEKDDKGCYRCLVKNYKGEEYSNDAVLTVETPVDIARQSPMRCSPNEETTTDMKPSIAQLTMLKNAKGEKVEIIKTIAPDWMEVGFLMDLDPKGRKIANIEAEHGLKRNGPVVCCREMFILWLDRPDATWGNLIRLLVDAEQKDLAEQVEDALDCRCY